MTDPHPIVVVGYDGSAASRAAVEVGIDRVGSTGHLVVVQAYHVSADYIGASYYQEMLDAQLGRSNAVIEDLVRDVERLSSVDWEADVIAGSPGEAICRVARVRDADEIVVGSRGHGRLRAVLGSVSLDVLHNADRPVLVIPEKMAEEKAAEPAAAASASG